MMKTILCLLLISASLHGQEVCRLRYERMEGSEVITGHGTAFNVEGKIVSAAHMVLDDRGKPYSVIKLEIGDKWLPCSVLRFDEGVDLCLLKCEGSLSPLKLAASDAIKGGILTLIGSKRGAELSTHNGVVEKTFASGLKTQMRVKFDHGDSGGPILEDGKVIGVASAGVPMKGDLDPNICLFIPLAALKEFLKQ